MEKLGIIILAAGNSSRLGRPKQLLEYQGKTLLGRVISEASQFKDTYLLVITGANRDSVENEISKYDAQFFNNELWENGMGSSLAFGVHKLLELSPQCSACIIAVSDQPFVTTELFRQMIDSKLQSGKNIVACQYGDTVGTPVLFDKIYFDKLLALSGHEGAKKVVMEFKDDVLSIPFEKGTVDIDTPEDYDKLSND